MGAWIEMSVVYLCGVRNKVAPFMGAWIEMYDNCLETTLQICRSLHGSVD